MIGTMTFPVINLVKTGRNIACLRRTAGLSVEALQEYFGFVFPQSVYKWQRGECLPVIDNLLALAWLLRVSVEDILVLDGNQRIARPARQNARRRSAEAADGAAYFPVIDLPGTGRNIERLRKAAGLSVHKLQDYFGFRYPQAIYRWQRGECLPTVDNLLALAQLFGVSVEELLVYEARQLFPRAVA